MDVKTGVYQIVNTTNGKTYIGSCANKRGFGHRWQKHRTHLERGTHHSAKLQAAWNKHGASAFRFEVILACDTDMCLQFEQAALDYFKPAYNVCLVANNRSGLRHSAETKRKIAQSLTGRKLSQSHKDNIRIVNIGKKHTEESKRKISQSNVGKHAAPTWLRSNHGR